MVNEDKNVKIFPQPERDEIESILIKIVREMQRSLDNLPDPKEYSSIILKEARSNITLATVLLLSLSFGLGPKDKLDPKEFRKRFGQESSFEPYQITAAFDRAKKEGAYTEVERHKKIRHPGRPKSSDNMSNNRGSGRPARTFQVSKGLVKLRKIISIEDANKLIHDRLNQEGILQEYYKFLILTFYYALRKEGSSEGILFKGIKTAFPNYMKNVMGYNEKIDINPSSWKSLVNDVFLRYDEKHFESLVAPRLANFLTENQLDYHSFFLKILPKLQ
ncbi:MAG: hypothetical protein GEU26_04775 [Nitrososphaeraceae archaeon]|nr:hypothetical protein [Nitrososphaeraceae archaeon]